MTARVVCACGWTKRYPTRARAEFNARRHICRAADGVRRATRHYRCARCGLEATYHDAGAKEARYWFDRHSCRKREEAMLRSALHEEKLAVIDRTPKPCHHKKADHQHGTNAAYHLDGCRCEPCSRAAGEATRQRERQKAYGRYHKYVTALPVREHVAQLRAAGMGLKTIAQWSGVGHGTLWKLVYGKKRPDGTQTPSRRVLRATAEKLYALDPDWTEAPLPLADGAVLSTEDSHPTHLRLQALVALGWSMSEIGRRLGITHSTNAIPIIKGQRRVTVATAKKAEAVFEQLSMTLPPDATHHQRVAVSRARNYARRHGWAPPLELPDLFDESSVAAATDLDQQLDEVAIQRRMAGDKKVRLTRSEAAELVRRWTASGRPLNECERLTGLAPRRYRDLSEAS